MVTEVFDSIEFINGRKIVKKHVAAVHSANNLSLLERKISNVLLYNSYKELKIERYHYITIGTLKKHLNFNSKNTKALKDAMQNLQRTILEHNLLNDKLNSDGLEEGLFSIQLLGFFQVLDGGIIKYSYPDELVNILSNPAIYAKINLPVQARFKSAYALALYENCVRFRGLKYTKNFELSVFRKLMGVNDGTYEIFRDFNKRVLIPAVTEINTSSDIRVQPDITRRSRRVVSIKFLLGERPIKQRIGSTKKPAAELQNQLQLLGVTSKDIEYLCQRFNTEQIDRATKYIKTTLAFKKNKISNLAGYIADAINNRYEKAISLQEVQKTHERKGGKGLTSELTRLNNLKGDLRQFESQLEEAKKRSNTLLVGSLEAVIEDCLKKMQEIKREGGEPGDE
jgi:plasmid replication initiation protein